LQNATKHDVSAAEDYVLKANSTSFKVHASGPGIACLTEAQAPDFTARVNGNSKPVLTINKVFKGVYLERAGDYRIDFVYRPRYWNLSCILFFCALAGLVLILLSQSARTFTRM
jgi:uncharacterized membrane protein YfhO